MGLKVKTKLSTIPRLTEPSVLERDNQFSQSVLVAPEHQVQTPQSPITFDTLGMGRVNVVISATGAFDLDIFGSVSAARDINDPGYDAEDPNTFPIADAKWNFITNYVEAEPKVYNMPLNITGMFSIYRWIKFDFKRGVAPEVSWYSAS